MKRYPIGIQSFDKIRDGGYVYVDKTEYVWRLVEEGQYYFLSRPRRFGKSLLISTLEAFFLGRRELFKGLAIDDKDYDWQEYPVLHLDLNTQNYTEENALHEALDLQLCRWEGKYGVSDEDRSLSSRFTNVIRAAYEATGRQVVVLIDEYDKPLLVNLFNKERLERFRDTLKAFYGVLKSCDRYIRFAFLTGVTKFGKVSVFSDLNNLRDISLLPAYNGICGISETELSGNFTDDIRRLADNIGGTYEQTGAQLKTNYDGYHFCRQKSEGIYNPFSVLNVLQNLEFDDYWFQTGTPTLLVELLKRTDTDLSTLDGTERSGAELMGLDPVFRDPVPVIFQSGYLTIKGYDKEENLYRLGFPNKEVERGFLNYLLPYYINPNLGSTGLKISVFVNALREGDVDSFMNELRSFMADIPYSKDNRRVPERRFSDVVFIVSRLMGYMVETEYMTNRGRIDLVVKTERYIYVIEFKVDKSPEEALAQIEEKGYVEPFFTDGREIIRVGAEFSTRTRNIVAWETMA